MGLETVEIVIDVEATFGISLPDSRASAIRTVGELHECIIDILGRENDDGRLTETVLENLQQALASRKGDTSTPINANTQLSALFPFFGRRRSWKRLEKAMQIPLPPLGRPHLLTTIVGVLAIPIGWIFAFLVVFPLFPSKTDSAAWFVAVLALGLGFASIFLFWQLGRTLTLPLAAFWPSNVRTVGELAGVIVETQYGKVVKMEQRFNREEVWCILQAIVARVLGVDRKAVTPEARFVEDLGAG